MNGNASRFSHVVSLEFDQAGLVTSASIQVQVNILTITLEKNKNKIGTVILNPKTNSRLLVVVRCSFLHTYFKAPETHPADFLGNPSHCGTCHLCRLSSSWRLHSNKKNKNSLSALDTAPFFGR